MADENNVAPETTLGSEGGRREVKEKDPQESSPGAEPRAIAAEALEFLRALAPAGPWDLVAIDAEKKRKLIGKRFGPDTAAEASAWVERLNADGRNLYYHVNALDDGGADKAKKEQIVALRALHVDIDPRAGEDPDKERERIAALLRSFQPAPTAVVASGGGFNALWALSEPLALVDDAARDLAERQNLALELALEGDHCHDVSRVLRLPGTVNWPDAKKRAKGRVPRLAGVVRDLTDWGRRYQSGEFPAAAARAEAAAKPAARMTVTPGKMLRPEDLDLSKLTQKQREFVLGRCVNPCDEDRSRELWRVCLELARAEVPPEQALALLMNPDLAIHAHIRDAGRGRMARYAARQVERAYAEVNGNFDTDESGKPLKTQRNIRLAIAKLDVHVSYDEFADRMMIEGLDGFGPALTDAAVSRLFLQVDHHFGLRVGVEYFWMVVQDHARRSCFHPVREYLDSVKWDGTPRVNRWLVTYGGAEDSEYSRAVGALMLVAAVRRIRQPGCKFDEMLVLESKQGKNKSTALATLAIERDWFSDDLPLSMETQGVIEGLNGRWIVEAAELNGMKKGDVEHLKAFLSRERDRARMAFGRIVADQPRQCVFVGTTNTSKYLRDSTGNRRFWPVRVEAFDIAALTRDRDQLWAEAAAREAAGESIRLDPRLYAAAAEQQEERRIEDPWVQVVEKYLGDRPGKLRAADAWLLVGVRVENRTQDHNGRLHAVMAELGFQRTKLRFGGASPEWCYARGDRNKAIVVTANASGQVASIGYEGEPPF